MQPLLTEERPRKQTFEFHRYAFTIYRYLLSLISNMSNSINRDKSANHNKNTKKIASTNSTYYQPSSQVTKMNSVASSKRLLQFPTTFYKNISANYTMNHKYVGRSYKSRNDPAESAKRNQSVKNKKCLGDDISTQCYQSQAISPKIQNEEDSSHPWYAFTPCPPPCPHHPHTHTHHMAGITKPSHRHLSRTLAHPKGRPLHLPGSPTFPLLPPHVFPPICLIRHNRARSV